MKRKTALLFALVLPAAALAEMPEGWRNVVSSNAAWSAAMDYANGNLRCVWAGDRPGVADAMPANAAFQFAIAGEETSVSNAQRVLDAARAALSDDLRERLAVCHLLAPTLQWMVRKTMRDATDAAAYLKPANHPAAFREADFNLTNLVRIAKKMTPSAVPPVVALHPQGEFSRNLPAPPATPGVDYPGVRTENVFSTPFGVGLALFAPQRRRIFRFRAVAWPSPELKVNFRWVPLTPGAWVRDWYGGKRASDGYGAVYVDWGAFVRVRRIDVAVFAQVKDGFWGAPSIISFYGSPYEERAYERDNSLRHIRYLPKVRKNPPPYDISSICLPADWTDYYRYDDKRRICGFNRDLPGSVRQEEYSDLGEIVLEHHPSDTPKVTMKVRYFEKDGQLRFKETGEEVTYKLAPFQPRLRGE